MASIKEIRSHIKSVQQTLKITNAMYLISSSNLRRAKRQLDDVYPYFSKIFSTISDILHHSTKLDHEFFDQRPEIPARQRKIGYIVVTGDKGLAGAYNHNVLKLVEEKMQLTDKPHLFVVGIVGHIYFQEHRIAIDEFASYTAQNPTMHRARMISDDMVRRFRERELDEVHIIYTEMKSALQLEVQERKLLPLAREDFPWKEPQKDGYNRVVTYVPSVNAVLDNIVPAYVKGMIFGALVEAYCSEQCARMMAMESASNNAKDMLSDLSLTYNRARQTAITQEITEIAGGAKNLI
ncbi:MAG: ATP synthase F1 subunit gamma [Oscillospiraceae bacterium]